MRKRMNRRDFLKGLGSGAAILVGAACAPAAVPTAAPTAAPKPAAPAPAAPTAVPTVAPTVAPTAAPKPAATAAPAVQPAPTAAAKPAAQGGRLVVAVGTWGTESAMPWRQTQSEKALWDHMYDGLIRRDPKTFGYVPSLATEWKSSSDYKTWTFKLRQGVMFHENYGEMTSEDVKFTIEQSLKKDAQGVDAVFWQTQLDKIDLPDKYTMAITFKTPRWDTPSHFAQFLGFVMVVSKKHLEAVGEEKAALNPIGTGPYRHVEGKQGDFHRFEAVPNHWRQTPGFKELVVRRVPDPATRLAGLRAGEIDIIQVFGDYLAQAKKAGFRIHQVQGGSQYWVVLPGQSMPDVPDYNPKLPWVGTPDPAGQENAKKVRLALNLAVNKKAIIDNLWLGAGSDEPFMYLYFPQDKGYDTGWKIPPYDPAKAKQLLAEAGYPNGFEIKVNPMVYTYAQDGPDVLEAVALDWEKNLGLKVKRVPEELGSFMPKFRAGKTDDTAWIYGSLKQDEPGIPWQRALWTKASFHVVAESEEWDKGIDAIFAEFDNDKRAKLTHDLGQKMYDEYRTVMLGTKMPTWALSKQVGEWPSLVSIPLENNLEYITPASQ